MNILVLSMGGTISQKASGAGGMVVSLDRSGLRAAAEGAHLTFVEVAHSTGANLDVSDILKLAGCIKSNWTEFDGFLVLVGTDSAEEVLYGLDLLLSPGKPVVATGAMRPADALGYDGLRNVRDALAVLRSPCALDCGILFVIFDEIHAARYLRKSDSQTLSAFASANGPMGSIRRGEAQFHYCGLPPIRRFPSLEGRNIHAIMPVVPMHLGVQVRADDFSMCHGLVLAGMGAGGVPDRVVKELSPSVTGRIPVCITSRCRSGGNYDDFHYKGSLDKYESAGFLVRPYEGLTPWQARIRMMFEWSESLGRPSGCG